MKASKSVESPSVKTSSNTRSTKDKHTKTQDRNVANQNFKECGTVPTDLKHIAAAMLQDWVKNNVIQKYWKDVKDDKISRAKRAAQYSRN